MTTLEKTNESGAEAILGQYVLSEEVRKIGEHLSQQVIDHERLRAAYEAVYSTIKENEVLSEPSHLLIVGDSGCGKTTLGDLIGDDFESRVDEFELGFRRKSGALIASVGSPVTPRSLAMTLLKALEGDRPVSGTSYEITNRLVFAVKQSEVKVVILDEVQHLYALGIRGSGGFSQRLRESLDWIKSVINRTGVTFILMGLPELLDLIKSDEQLARRFSKVLYLRPFDCPSEESNDVAHFADSLLSEACELPYFDRFEPFTGNVFHASRLYLSTSGTPGRVARLVHTAAVIAYEAGDSEIGIRHFAQAYKPEQEVRSEISRVNAETDRVSQTLSQVIEGDGINPFTLDTSDLFSISKQQVA